MKTNHKDKGAVGLIVLFVMLVLLAAALYYQSDDRRVGNIIPENQEASMGKVAAANIKDGKYYGYIVAINSNPEDTTVTFNRVTYIEGSPASSATETDDASFTAPLISSASLTGEQLRVLVSDTTYRPIFLVVIEGGAIVGIREATSR